MISSLLQANVRPCMPGAEVARCPLLGHLELCSQRSRFADSACPLDAWLHATELTLLQRHGILIYCYCPLPCCMWDGRENSTSIVSFLTHPLDCQLHGIVRWGMPPWLVLSRKAGALLGSAFFTCLHCVSRQAAHSCVQTVCMLLQRSSHAIIRTMICRLP